MLVNRNITVGDLRTSVRLEPEFWSSLSDISIREKVSVDQLCTLIDAHLGELGRTAAIRVFIASYFAAQKSEKQNLSVPQPYGRENMYRADTRMSQRAFG